MFVYRTDRVCQESITINGYRFDKGDTFLMNIIGIHHNPEYWPDPEKFDPERQVNFHFRT